MALAPICLFTYKRLDCTQQTVDFLQKNTLAKSSKLYIFSDGAKKAEDWVDIQKVRDFTAGIQGFQEIEHIHRQENIGLANSIIQGVSKVIQEHKKVIVMEDDLITTSNYLTFMNEALDFYQNNPKIFSIAGYTIPIKIPKNYSSDVYVAHRHNPWGWASWQDRWETVDWEVKSYSNFQTNQTKRKKFNLGGSDLANMLDKQMSEKLDSWAIRWGFQQFINNQRSVYPVISKVRNIGFGPDATHTKFYDRYRSELDNTNKSNFNFTTSTEVPNFVLKTYQNKYSLLSRLIGRLKHYLRLP